MAKIDVSKIEGYSEMSAEDKLKVPLEAYEFETPAPKESEETTRLKPLCQRPTRE